MTKFVTPFFHDRRQSIRYNASLAITGVIGGTSFEKLYQKLGLQSLKLIRQFGKLCHFYKIFKEKPPSIQEQHWIWIPKSGVVMTSLELI